MIKRFLSSVFPIKGDSKGQIIRKIIAFVAFIVLVVSLIQIASYYSQSIANSHANSTLAKISSSTVSEVSSTVSQSPYPAGMISKFYSFFDINKDIRGWVKIPNTNIDYPVVQYTDNAYYLKKDFYNKDNKYGVPFLDSQNVLNPNSQNLIIYGHNMNDDQMFHELIKYKDVNFYKTSPIISFDTIYGSFSWKIFAVFVTDTDANGNDNFQYRYTGFGSSDQFVSFISDVNKRSVINTAVNVQASDKLLTLSTCAYDIDNERFVVMARLVRDGEDLNVGTAVKNPKPLYPDIWYKVNGGTKPTFTSSSSK